MTNVIKLMIGVVILRPRRKREPAFFHDLNGKAPIGHPFANRDNRKQVQLVVGQVWVDNEDKRLWRLLQVRHTGTVGSAPLAVQLRPLAGSKRIKTLGEGELRRTMRAYEDALAHHQQEIRERAKNLLTRLHAMRVIEGGNRPP
jgi:hypothetical protein